MLIGAFVVLRILGRLLGGLFAARVDRVRTSSRLPGPALFPQAGVAIGMALVVSARIPEFGATVLAATMAATVFFEGVGPICTRRVLEYVGEIQDLE